jgi:deoxyribodipyrimidine photo-lyase
MKYKKHKLDAKIIDNYEKYHDYPAKQITSNLGIALRFGTISIRHCVAFALQHSLCWLSELIWREFFMQILYHYPYVINQAFKSKYDFIEWRNNEIEFELWCNGKTGFPLVDAGMRQLNETGFMHNRVRMVAASFLCKELLIDWKWGEAYFAQKLNDFELSSNNGNWQWVAGTGCDSVPYFRIFNPSIQIDRFDKDLEYIRKWLPEFETEKYIKPIVNHNEARERALKVYNKIVKGK